MDDKELKDFERSLDDAFKARHSFAQLKRLMDEVPDFTYIGSGSARLVYKVNDDKVIKLAKNTKGIAQNETEADWGLKNYGVAAEWYDISDQGIWIESEFCQKVKVTDFKKEVGIKFQDYCDCLRWYKHTTGRSKGYCFKPEIYDSTWENEFMCNIYSYIGDFGVPVGDLTRISSYGFDHQHTIVLVDTGLSDNVYEEHYGR